MQYTSLYKKVQPCLVYVVQRFPDVRRQGCVGETRWPCAAPRRLCSDWRTEEQDGESRHQEHPGNHAVLDVGVVGGLVAVVHLCLQY